MPGFSRDARVDGRKGQPRWLPAAFVLAAALLLGGAVRAEVRNVSASKDNTIYEPSGDKSNGSGEYLFAGHTLREDKRRALIAFDVAAAVPAGATIDSVTLTLHMSRTQALAETVSLHRLAADWGEGASDAPGNEGDPGPAADGDATWSYRFYDASEPLSSVPWTADGAAGDFSASASAATAVSGVGSYGWGSTAAMVADVQTWLDDPAANFGWILIGGESGSLTAKRFDSRENATAANRPVLTIGFTPPPSSGACCGGGGECSVVLDPGTSCTGAYLGAGTVCTPNPCPEPEGACCFPDAAATCGVLTAAVCASQGGTFQGALTGCTPNPCPVVLEPFVDSLPVPAVAQPVMGAPGGAASYQIAMRELRQKLHRDLPLSTVWGYGDGPSGATFPGPTIEAAAGSAVTVTWMNDLRDSQGNLRTEHYLPVDSCPHGAGDASPRAVVHLHGGHVAAEFDGYPEDTILPGQQVQYQYPNQQLPATLWYHDHALGITRLNVYMGLAGLYLIRDATEAALGLPSGEFEIPLVVQDRKFRPDGSLEYPEMWHEHFFGDTILVNGKVWPVLHVKQGKYRFRLLNGSTSRTYTLSLSNGAPFQQIGTDGGLLPAPVPVDEITLSPAERADVIVDFASVPAGTEIVLTNSAPAPFPGEAGVGVIPNVMQFVVDDAPGHTAAVPAALRPLATLDEMDAVQSRSFELRKGSDACTGSAWLINGLRWHDVTEYPELGTSEIWSFVNRSGVTHPLHLHLVMFQVLDRQPFEVVGGEVVPTGPPVPPPPGEAGWKDTVAVGPAQIARVIARFEDYTGKFPYHCHILEHEDHEMMRQFQTVSCGNGVVEPGEECDDGNTADGDCCSSDCQTLPSPLDVDASGPPPAVATDVVYIARRLAALPPVPAAYRVLDPAIPDDATIGAAVDALGGALDVDGSGSVDVATDVVYLARAMLGLPPVPPSFRVSDPGIPPDAAILAAIAALCPAPAR